MELCWQSSDCQSSDFMAAVTVHRGFGAQEDKMSLLPPSLGKGKPFQHSCHENPINSMKRRHTDGQKMFNIANYWRNEINTTVKYQLTPVKMTIIKFTNNKCWTGYRQRKLPKLSVGI